MSNRSAFPTKAIVAGSAFLAGTFAAAQVLAARKECVPIEGTLLPYPNCITPGLSGFDYMVAGIAGMALAYAVWALTRMLMPSSEPAGFRSGIWRHILPITGLVLLAMTTAAAAGAGFVGNDDESPSASDTTASEQHDVLNDPRLRAQAPLAEAKREIAGLVRERDLKGFTGMRLDQDATTGAVWLYWKGELPAEMAGLVEELREKVRVKVVEAPYSQTELQEEALRIGSLDSEDWGFRITGAASLRDFSGINVYVSSEDEIPLAKEVITSDISLRFSVRGPGVLLPYEGPDSSTD